MISIYHIDFVIWNATRYKLPLSTRDFEFNNWQFRFFLSIFHVVVISKRFVLNWPKKTARDSLLAQRASQIVIAHTKCQPYNHCLHKEPAR